MDDEPDSQIDTPPDRRALISHHLEALYELSDPATRIDGWTPFARRTFLATLAETGRVKTAAQFAGMTKQSAYALRARDPVFAAGWDAACELARMPLADELYEQAVDGVTETLTRDDGRTVTRHRFDSRLSIAVLNRLDRRCDRAAEQGARHLGAIARWDDFIAAVGDADQEAALAILETAKVGQASQLPDGDEMMDEEEKARIWWDLKEWRTDFPPPDDFDGDESGDYGEWRYSRTLTEDELRLVEADGDRDNEAERTADAEERDHYFAALRADLLEDKEDEPAAG